MFLSFSGLLATPTSLPSRRNQSAAVVPIMSLLANTFFFWQLHVDSQIGGRSRCCNDFILHHPHHCFRLPFWTHTPPNCVPFTNTPPAFSVQSIQTHTLPQLLSFALSVASQPINNVLTHSRHPLPPVAQIKITASPCMTPLLQLFLVPSATSNVTFFLPNSHQVTEISTQFCFTKVISVIHLHPSSTLRGPCTVAKVLRRPPN